VKVDYTTITLSFFKTWDLPENQHLLKEGQILWLTCMESGTIPFQILFTWKVKHKMKRFLNIVGHYFKD
jgi:hypothetical protein